MIELLLFLIIVICALCIANEWAKYSLVGLTLQRPLNGRVIGAILIATIAFMFTKLLQKSGDIETNLLNAENSLALTIFMFSICAAWIIIRRYVLMPRGKYVYNLAITRTIYWASIFYRPGIALKDEAKLLRNSLLANRTLTRFYTAIRSLERGMRLNSDKHYINFYDNNELTALNRQNIAIAYEEAALLYRMMNEFQFAHESLDRALEIINSLLNSDTSNVEYLRLKSLILFRHAEAYQAEGIHKNMARKFYSDSLEIEDKFGTNEDIVFTKNLLLKLELS